MRCPRLFPVLLSLLFALPAAGAEPPQRLLLVTHAGGFMHDSVLVAEQVLRDVGPKNGLEVTCWRYTNDPDARVKKKKKVDGEEVEYETTALAAYSDEFRSHTGE